MIVRAANVSLSLHTYIPSAHTINIKSSRFNFRDAFLDANTCARAERATRLSALCEERGRRGDAVRIQNGSSGYRKRHLEPTGSHTSALSLRVEAADLRDSETKR